VIDVKIMAMPRRKDMVDVLLAGLGLDESAVCYDDRPNGGDPIYTAKKCWLAPLGAGVTHRLVLQDDIEVCNGFLEIVERAAATFPAAVYSFYNSRIELQDRIASSPYVLVRGGRCQGQAILMPVSCIEPCFRWIAQALGADYRHDDAGVGEYCWRHGIPMMTTIPSTVQHHPGSLLNHRVGPSKVWGGCDLPAEDWGDRNYSVTKQYLNGLFLPAGHPYEPAPKGERASLHNSAMARLMDVVSSMEMVPIGKIKPYARNARKNDPTVAKLVELIPKVGFNVPLVLDRANVIVKGHTRWKAAIRLGMKALPCVYTDADEETKKLDRLADNRVQEFSSWDPDLLASELAGLNLSFPFDMAVLDWKIELPGPAPPPITGNGSAGSAANGDDGVPPSTAEQLAGVQSPQYIEVLCDKCGHKLYVKK
jgi:hypothetical protein